MKRAIYVGKSVSGWMSWLNYGTTGEAWRETIGWRFASDGGSQSVGIDRADIYIPSEDQTRHCPKPT